MPRQSKGQKETIARVMHEFKHGELDRPGGKVRNPKQAIAIALREAGVSTQATPEENRMALRRTKAREQQSGRSKADLYAEAARRGIPGRSRMSKDELVRALAKG